MTLQKFLQFTANYYGEPLTDIKQLTEISFTGEGLYQYVSELMKFIDASEQREFFRPKTRGELAEKIKAGIRCEVVASNQGITDICLDGWLKGKGLYRTYPSHNTGWVVYEAI